MCGGEGGGLEVKSRTFLKIVFSVLFFTTMFRNDLYMHQRDSIRFPLFLMTLDSRVRAQGGARGFFFFFFFFFLILWKNDILLYIYDQGPDPQCPRSSPRLSIQVSSVYCSKIDLSFYYIPPPPPSHRFRHCFLQIQIYK